MGSRRQKGRLVISLPVLIQGEHGQTYPAFFCGWWDMREIGLGWEPSIGRQTQAGISHGMLRPGETMLTEVPAPAVESARIAPTE